MDDMFNWAALSSAAKVYIEAIAPILIFIAGWVVLFRVLGFLKMPVREKGGASAPAVALPASSTGRPARASTYVRVSGVSGGRGMRRGARAAAADGSGPVTSAGAPAAAVSKPFMPPAPPVREYTRTRGGPKYTKTMSSLRGD